METAGEYWNWTERWKPFRFEIKHPYVALYVDLRLSILTWLKYQIRGCWIESLFWIPGARSCSWTRARGAKIRVFNSLQQRSILKIIWKRFRSFSDTENAMNFKVYQTIFSFENVLRISQTIFSSENYLIVSHSIFSSEKSYDIFQYIFSYWKCYEFSQTVFQLWKSSDNLSAYFQYRKIIWEFLSLFSGSVNYLIFSQLIFSIWKLSDNFSANFQLCEFAVNTESDWITEKVWIWKLNVFPC